MGTTLMSEDSPTREAVWTTGSASREFDINNRISAGVPDDSCAFLISRGNSSFVNF